LSPNPASRIPSADSNEDKPKSSIDSGKSSKKA
jgi:hypothetical protein